MVRGITAPSVGERAMLRGAYMPCVAGEVSADLSSDEVDLSLTCPTGYWREDLPEPTPMSACTPGSSTFAFHALRDVRAYRGRGREGTCAPEQTPC